MMFRFLLEQEKPPISVYPTEEDRQNADKLRNGRNSTYLGGIVKEIIRLSGDVIVHFLTGKLLE